ncbi:MAG: hypothetical protein WC718_02095 [Phycisphaerales bacterium]
MKNLTVSAWGENPGGKPTPSNCSAHVLELESDVLRAASPQAREDFFVLRRSMPLEHFEFVLQRLKEVKGLWRRCRFRLYSELSDEFAHRLRAYGKHGKVFTLTDLQVWVDEIQNRVDGPMRRDLDRRG